MSAEHATVTYLELARIAHDARQLIQRDKLFVLAGAAACHAGVLDVAEQCRRIVATRQPAHRLARYKTFPDALRDPEFASFWRQLQRFCSAEKAEHLVTETRGGESHTSLDQLQDWLGTVPDEPAEYAAHDE